MKPQGKVHLLSALSEAGEKLFDSSEKQTDSSAGRSDTGDSPRVNEELIRENAIGVLYGTVSEPDARRRIDDNHRDRVKRAAQARRPQLVSEVNGIQKKLRPVKDAYSRAAELLGNTERYVKENFKKSGESLKPWNAAVTMKLIMLLLSISAALSGGVVGVTNVLLSQPSWEDRRKALLMSLAFVLLPAWATSLKYKAMLSKDADKAERFRGALSWGIIVCFILGAGGFTLLYSERGEPQQSDIDITDLMNTGLESGSEISEFETTLFHYLPAIVSFLIMLLDFLSTAYCKTHITDIFCEYGWPLVRKMKESPEYLKEEARCRKLADKLAKLEAEEAKAQEELRNFDEEMATRMQMLSDEALSKFDSMLGAISQVQNILPQIFPNRKK